MAPQNASKKQAEQAAAAEDVESEQETLDPRAISKDMEKNTHARKTQKRNQLSAKYEQEMASLDEQVVSVTETATKQLADIRHSQQKRLRDLIVRQAEIEDEIVRRSHVLDQAYEAANREMKAAARGRLDDLLSDNNDDEQDDRGGDGLDVALEGHAGGVDGRRMPGKKAVRHAEEMARKGLRA